MHMQLQACWGQHNNNMQFEILDSCWTTRLTLRLSAQKPL